MSKNRDRLDRRQLLRLLADAYPAPVPRDELSEALLSAFPDRMDAALTYLLTHGYAENKGNAAEPWYVITGTGLDQIRREANPLDAGIHGPEALA